MSYSEAEASAAIKTLPILSTKAPSIHYILNAARYLVTDANATLELINGDTGESAYNKQLNEIIKAHSYPKYYLYLLSYDLEDKAAAITETQNITGLSLAEATTLVESAPVVYKDINTESAGAYDSFESAKEAAVQLKAAGAGVSVEIVYFADDGSRVTVRYE